MAKTSVDAPIEVIEIKESTTDCSDVKLVKDDNGCKNDVLIEEEEGNGLGKTTKVGRSP